MQATVLECGHDFMWSDIRPRDLTFCFRCDDYRMPTKKEKGVRPAGNPTGGRAHFPKHQRADIVAWVKMAHSHGATDNEIANLIGISPLTVKQWLIGSRTRSQDDPDQ